jgi:hypothetical protein
MICISNITALCTHTMLTSPQTVIADSVLYNVIDAAM